MNTCTKNKLLIILFFITFSAFSQSNEMGNWLMYFGQNKIKERLSLHTEVQYRNHTIAPVNIEQLLLRTGLNYHLAPNAMVTAGYGYVTSYDETDSSTCRFARKRLEGTLSKYLMMMMREKETGCEYIYIFQGRGGEK